VVCSSIQEPSLTHGGVKQFTGALVDTWWCTMELRGISSREAS
jgi:hypothetical protein